MKGNSISSGSISQWGTVGPPPPRSPWPSKDYQPSPSPLETIQKGEIKEAEKQVFEKFKKVCGLYPPHVAGYNVLLQIYQRESEKDVSGPDGKTTKLMIRSDRAVAADKYSSVVALVIGMGPQAYQGNNFDGTPRFPEGYWCAIGDFVIIANYTGTQISYGDPKLGAQAKLPLVIVPDDKILAKIYDPESVVATHVVDREMA